MYPYDSTILVRETSMKQQKNNPKLAQLEQHFRMTRVAQHVQWANKRGGRGVGTDVPNINNNLQAQTYTSPKVPLSLRLHGEDNWQYSANFYSADDNGWAHSIHEVGIWLDEK